MNEDHVDTGVDSFPSDYREGHTFPSGINVTFYTIIDEEYRVERDAITSDEQLAVFCQRWRYLFPELGKITDVHVGVLKSLVASKELQDEYVDKATKGDSIATAYLNLFLPPSLVKPLCFALEYGVTTGTVIMQMWNAELFHECPDGTWLTKRTRDEPAPATAPRVPPVEGGDGS